MNNKSIITCESINKKLLILLIISLLSIFGSYGIEWAYNAKGCPLCYLQRTNVCVTALLALYGIIYKNKRLIIFVLFLTTLTSLTIATYHIFIQLGWLKDSCNVLIPSNIENFKISVFRNSTPCSTIISVVGLPASFWSFLISVFSFGLILPLYSAQTGSVTRKAN